MNKALFTFPHPRRNSLSCAWIATGNAGRPLVCVWTDDEQGGAAASVASPNLEQNADSDRKHTRTHFLAPETDQGAPISQSTKNSAVLEPAVLVRRRWQRSLLTFLMHGVCGAPNFDRPGTSTEGQAFCILM